jgi:hypothetical protein
VSPGARFVRRFSETIFGDVVVGALTAVLTGVLTGQWIAALVVGAASVLCFLMWMGIEISGGRRAYAYEEL